MKGLRSPQDDPKRAQWDEAIRRAGLRGDPFESVLTLLPEFADRLEAAATRAERAGGPAIDPQAVERTLRQVARIVLPSEERRRWMLACAICLALGMIPGAIAGYYGGWHDGFVQSCIVGR